MAIPRELRRTVEALLESFYLRCAPPTVRHEFQLIHTSCGNTITLYERRPAWRRAGEWTELTIAQFRYAPDAEVWQLYWNDRNDRWHTYTDLEPTPRFLTLLAEVHLDPTGIFWG